MKNLIIAVIMTVFIASCKSSKPNSQTKKGCDTCPSLSNEGKIDKPFKSKKRK
ncbi:MAG: hypothetical protein H7329_11990 [Opitutaceae bacterium]|nr:hypothetical protein [Cytophagales bacterium]